MYKIYGTIKRPNRIIRKSNFIDHSKWSSIMPGKELKVVIGNQEISVSIYKKDGKETLNN